MAKENTKSGLGIGQTVIQTQTLTPIQIQTIKLLELPYLELEQKIQKEIEENPVLEDPVDSESEDNEQERKVVLLRIASGYTADDLKPGAEDKYGDKDLHRNFLLL